MSANANTLVHFSPQPLHAQIKETLRARIVGGTYPPLGQMPSEHALCAMRVDRHKPRKRARTTR